MSCRHAALLQARSRGYGHCRSWADLRCGTSGGFVAPAEFLGVGMAELSWLKN